MDGRPFPGASRYRRPLGVADSVIGPERFHRPLSDIGLTSGMRHIARLGVLGGTFDPIHIGHLIAASEACSQFQLDQVLFVPAGDPWQKREHAEPEDRFLMVELAIEPDPRFAASRMEIDRKGPTYTVETLELLRRSHPGAELFFITGADAVTLLPSWYRFEDLADLTEIIVAARPGAEAPVDGEPGWPKIHHLEMVPIGVSSTDVRARIRADKPVNYMVPARVLKHIGDAGLYRDGAA
jgi:nicotinate-nucleotide adenylyltransferase